MRRRSPKSLAAHAAALAIALLPGGLGCRSGCSPRSDVAKIGTGSGASATGAGGAVEVATVAASDAAPPVAFPLVHSPDRRYLQDQTGRPFAIKGRASWGVLLISAADARSYLDDTVANGYTAIEVSAIVRHSSSKTAPLAGNGAAPFLKRLDGTTWTGAIHYGNAGNEAPDLTTPNPAYWTFVDSFLTDCEARGLLVFLFPAYMGSDATAGWRGELTANGPARVTVYGAFIAARYKNRKNLIWMAGGDAGTGAYPFTLAEVAAEQALLAGMASVSGQQSVDFSAEWASESIATGQPTFGGAMTVNGAYSFNGDVNTQARAAYSHTPTEPAFLLEEPYDEEGPDGNGVNPHATQPVRRFQWWGWLSAIGGTISGNGYVWPFNAAPSWKDHLDTAGARDLRQLNGFMRSIAWWQLVPSGLGGMKTLVTAGGSSPADPRYVAAAATPSGALLVAYVPPAHTGPIAIDMTALRRRARARWFNPVTAASVAAGEFPNTGTQVFTPPGDNGSGFADWVLVLEAP